MSGVRIVLQRFVSFYGLKNEAYTRVLSLFRKALVPFHGFSVLVFDSGFKRVPVSNSTRVRARGSQCFKNELCYVCVVLVSTHSRVMSYV